MWLVSTSGAEYSLTLPSHAWNQVYNGMTQLGYEKAYNEFSFSTEQRDVTLYLTAVASLSGLVQKPTIKISPDEGLDVHLSGSGANGSPPTTLSPTMMLVEWRCEKARDTPYEVEITIPIENYDPIQFTLAKMCEHTQNERDEATRGWAIFGIISCISIVVLMLACCGGFIYRTRIGNLRGIDALPGISNIISMFGNCSQLPLKERGEQAIEHMDPFDLREQFDSFTDCPA
ncbi:UNVERIFIED_CONTAM: hypothetical protein Slati_1393500 [Sesamum latifolium]|uniref:Uncharacterized protein n=1 Tax=Sesamum latifolium TaxID=2727402 RepID=A0AAW2X460_9LAMI